MRDMAVMDYGDPTGRGMVEGVAKVVALEADGAWLEIEASAGCGACAAKSGCGVAGKAKGGQRRQRFLLPNHFGGRIGERVVIGIPESMLLRASALAYAVPVLTMVGGAVLAGAFGAGDGGAALGGLAGLVAGLGFAHLRARRLADSGGLSPVYLRHAKLDLSANCAFDAR